MRYSSDSQSVIETVSHDQDIIQKLVLAARQHPPGSRQRNHYLNQIIRLVQPKLWKYPTPFYAEALQQTWEYFAKTVCTTYDPTRATIATWLNAYLKYRHLDLVIHAQQQQQREQPIDEGHKHADGSPHVFDIPSHHYGSLSWLDELIEMVELDVDGRLQRICMKGRPEITAQTLILLRIPNETPWKKIAEQLGAPIPSLSSFYQRQCIPVVREMAAAIRTSA